MIMTDLTSKATLKLGGHLSYVQLLKILENVHIFHNRPWECYRYLK